VKDNDSNPAPDRNCCPLPLHVAGVPGDSTKGATSRRLAATSSSGSPADHSELKRDLYTANFVFLFKSHVPNEFIIPINPLGLTITYFREDKAFK
jgi:hypothetical protein